MQYPAGLDSAIFHSHGSQLLGGFYRAAGAAPRPTVILCHGVPGVEKNLDLAYALRDAGFNALYFHYRGSWGSEGTYSFNGLVDDVRAATEWVLARPEVDPARLILAGSSMGGYATLAAGAADPRFFALVPICPLLDGVDAPMPRDLAVESAAMLRGVSADELQRQWSALPSIVSLAGQLRGRRMLLVTGERDELFPPAHYAPLSLLLPEMQRQHFAVGDHGFSLCRPALVATIVQWLKELARP